jgi:transcriptional regulator with XRE-family HTH domain
MTMPKPLPFCLKSTYLRRLSALLRRHRLATGLSQEMIGDLCGIPQGHISRYESGKCMPAAHTMARLAAGYGIPADDLARMGQP